jgi:hypothetical protein
MLKIISKINLTKDDKVMNLILLAINILCISLFLMLGYFNRFSSDDFAYYFRVRDMGIWHAFIFAYKTWNTRWASILFMNVMMEIFNPESSLLLYYIFILGLFFVSVYRLLRSLFIYNFMEISPVTTANYSMLLISCFLLCTFGIDESWFWMNASTIYILPVIFLCLGTSYILDLKNNFITHLMLNVSFFIAGGGNEPLAILTIVMFGTTFITESVSKRLTLFNHPARKHLHKLKAALTVLILSFMVNAFCPGIAVRKGFLPPANANHIIASILYTGFLLCKSFFVYKLIFIIPFTLLWMYIGNQFYIQKYRMILRLKFILTITLANLFFISFFVITICCMLLHGMAPMRAMTVISFFMTGSFAYIGFCLGCKIPFPKLFRIVYYFSTLIIAISLAVIICIQYPIAKAHAEAYDQRIIALKTLEINHNLETQTLKLLPQAGWLYAADISPDTNNIQNKYFREALGLKFNVELEMAKTP